MIINITEMGAMTMRDMATRVIILRRDLLGHRPDHNRDLVAGAARRGEDVGSDATLAGYERARRFDVARMAAATDGLYRLFASPATRTLRDVGMGLVDRAAGLKAKIVEAAAGL